MKKFLPLIIFGLGVLLFAGVFIMKSRSSKAGPTPVPGDDEVVAEIPFDKRPFVSLTPTEDGHWLNMAIQGIKVDGAATLDYLVEYQVADGRSQGVPGEIELEGEEVIARELLLGSESSGKYRYDEGVENGTLTLRFRNDKGKLIGKLTTNFLLQKDVEVLGWIDGDFQFTFDKVPKATYFVTMNTFGVPASLDSAPTKGPFGIFSSSDLAHPGSVSLDGDVRAYIDSGWLSLDDSSSSDIGVFVSSN